MRLLYIVPRSIWPPTDGGQIVAFNTLKSLALRGHDITVASVGLCPAEVPELQCFCTWLPGQKRVADSYSAVLANLVSPLPYTIAKYRDGSLGKELDALCGTTGFDIIQAEGLHTAHYAVQMGWRHKVPAVLRAYNVESEIMEGYWRHSHHALVRTYARVQHSKLLRYESRVARQVDICIMLSHDDEQTIRRMSPAARVSAIPAGVDLSFFHPRPIGEDPNSVVFVGSLDWFPNEEGIRWFLEDVFPLLRKSLPDCRLLVVGKNPPAWLQKLTARGVTVTGFVDDVRDYMARAQVFVAPLLTGSGVRIKILNAMAMGRPVVATSVGAKGLPLEHAKHALIVDDAAGFADAILGLLDDEARRVALGRAGRDLVLREFSWERIAELLEGVYLGLLREARRG